MVEALHLRFRACLPPRDASSYLLRTEINESIGFAYRSSEAAQHLVRLYASVRRFESVGICFPDSHHTFVNGGQFPTIFDSRRRILPS